MAQAKHENIPGVSATLMQLSSIVKQVAHAEIMPRYLKVKRQTKVDGSIVTAADIAVQSSMIQRLQAAWPGVALLGEEMSAAEHARIASSAQPFWCLDPVDGTSNFASGYPAFAVSLALIEAGQTSMGVIYDPVRDECFMAEKGRGAFLNHQRLHLSRVDMPLNRCIAMVDYKRLPTALVTRLVTEKPYASQRNLGSIALEWCWAAAGRFQVYLHGQQNLWDYAVGHLLLAEAGGYASTLSGEPILASGLQPISALAAVDEALFHAWGNWLKGA